MLRPRSQQYLNRHTDINLRRREVLTVLVKFAEAHGGATPTERGLWRYFKLHAKQDFGFDPMAYSTLRGHLKTLVDVDKVIEKRDGVIVIPGATMKLNQTLPLISANPRQLPLPI